MARPGLGLISRAVVAVGVGLVLAAPGCSGAAKKSAAPPTTSPTPATSGPPTTSATSAAGNAGTPAIAAALSRSLLTAVQVQQALGLAAVPTPEPPGPKATPQGPLSQTAMLTVLPDAAVAKPMYESAGGGVGANVLYHAASPKLDVDILAAKFATAAGGRSFVQQTADLATTLGQGRATADSGLSFGVLPRSLQEVIRVPPGPFTDPTSESIVADLLYPDGIDYLVSLLAPPGSVTDAMVVALVKVQNDNYLAARASLDRP